MPTPLEELRQILVEGKLERPDCLVSLRREEPPAPKRPWWERLRRALWLYSENDLEATYARAAMETRLDCQREAWKEHEITFTRLHDRVASIYRQSAAVVERVEGKHGIMVEDVEQWRERQKAFIADYRKRGIPLPPLPFKHDIDDG